MINRYSCFYVKKQQLIRLNIIKATSLSLFEDTLYIIAIRVFLSFELIKDASFEWYGLSHAKRTLRKHASAILYLTIGERKRKRRKESASVKPRNDHARESLVPLRSSRFIARGCMWDFRARQSKHRENRPIVLARFYLFPTFVRTPAVFSAFLVIIFGIFV